MTIQIHLLYLYIGVTFQLLRCFSRTRLTADRSVAKTAEMRLLQSDSFFQFVRKPAGQIWTMFLLESPANTGEYPNARDLVNWTATYRWDSTLVTPYEKFVPFRNATRLPRQRAASRRWSTGPVATPMATPTAAGRRNYAAGKTKMVAWFVSNCGPKNNRNAYAAELAKSVLFYYSPFICSRQPAADS